MIALDRHHVLLVLTALLGLAVVALAATIITSQYRVREVTIQIEQAQETGRRLLEEQREISIELAKVTLPGAVAQGAKNLGLEVARNENTVILQPKPVPHFVTKKSEGGGR